MNVKEISLGLCLALSVLMANTAEAVNVEASCGCEHFATPFDQICEASPQFAPVPGDFLYRYIWSATDSNVIIDPQVSTSPVTTASCFNGSGCEVKLSVKVQAIDSFYFPFQIFVYDEDTVECASGTPNPGM